MKIHDREGTNALSVDEEGAVTANRATAGVQHDRTIGETLDALLTEMRVTNFLLGQTIGLGAADVAALRGDPTLN